MENGEALAGSAAPDWKEGAREARRGIRANTEVNGRKKPTENSWFFKMGEAAGIEPATHSALRLIRRGFYLLSLLHVSFACRFADSNRSRAGTSCRCGSGSICHNGACPFPHRRGPF